MPSRFSHFLLLSEAFDLMTQTTITQLELFYAAQRITDFVQQFETLCSLENMPCNLHILTHASDCVSRWGPLWAYSTHSFEGCIGGISKLCNGTRSINIQVTKTNIACQLLTVLKARSINVVRDSDFIETQRCLLGDFVPTIKALRAN